MLMSLEWDAFSATDPGMVRTNNEDVVVIAYGKHPRQQEWTWRLYLVADGMGGHGHGAIASMLAAEVITDTIRKMWPSVIAPGSSTLTWLLAQAVEKANRAIYRENQDKGWRMGTTITAALCQNQWLALANVGDSRTYLERAGLHQLTEDHSYVASLVTQGKITKEAVYTHPQRNVISRALGLDAEVEVDLFQGVLQPSDTLLLCSDGLWEMVHDPELQVVLHRQEPARMVAEHLVAQANHHGGEDNVSAIVVKIAVRA